MVGRVMHNWAKLETQVLMLTAWALQMQHSQAAKVTQSFRAFSLSLDFAQSACATRLGKDTKYLSSIIGMIREVSGDRNFVAHTQIVAHGTKQAPSEVDWARVTPKIGPPLKDYLSGSVPKREPMDSDEVSEVAEDIQHLITELMEFEKALRSRRPWPQKFLKPIEPRRPRLAERRAKSD